VAYIVGWTFVPDIGKPCYLPVIAVDAENKSITVKGDASGLAAPLESRYHLIPPAGIARSTGALAKPEDAGDSTWNGAGSYDDPGAKWLWSGYLYVAPQAGHEVSGTTYGTQSGVNYLGQYHCWNREYDVNQGRWTTPDPVSAPFWNRQLYVFAQPTRGTDATGLKKPEFDWGFALTYTGTMNGRCPEEVILSVSLELWGAASIPFTVGGWPMGATLWLAGWLSGSVQVCTNPQSWKIGILSGEVAVTLQLGLFEVGDSDMGFEVSVGVYGSVKATVEYDPCEGTLTIGKVTGELGFYARAILGWGRFRYFKELFVGWDFPITKGAVFDAPKIPHLCKNVDCCPEHGKEGETTPVPTACAQTATCG